MLMPLNSTSYSVTNILLAIRIVSTSVVIGAILALIVCKMLGEVNNTIMLSGVFVGLLHGFYALNNIVNTIGIKTYEKQVNGTIDKDY